MSQSDRTFILLSFVALFVFCAGGATLANVVHHGAQRVEISADDSSDSLAHIQCHNASPHHADARSCP